MNKLILVALLTSVTCGSFAEVYKWTDSQGNVHFSDVPHEGAETIKIPEAQSYSPPANSQSQSGSETVEPDEVVAEGQSKVKSNIYNKIQITQPEDQATIRNNQGAVLISAQVDPALQNGDTAQLIYDGRPIGGPQHTLFFQVKDVYRGAHTISIKILSPNGAEIISSQPITFYMHRPRVGMVKGKTGN